MDKTRELIARAAGTLGVIVSIVTILGVLGSGVVTAVFGFGWFLDWMHGGPAAAKFELASVMLKITFPYLWFITFVALSCRSTLIPYNPRIIISIGIKMLLESPPS